MSESPRSRLQEFIREHKPMGGCKVLSLGDKCGCPLCDLDKICKELQWYSEHASAMARYVKEKKYDAIEACFTSLALDAGKRADSVIIGE